ncbi:MAG: hypothetical protein K2Y37_02430 [Pirellulales bacterium]|nr:hypothetical protein [Pirellulales bacterium]
MKASLPKPPATIVGFVVVAALGVAARGLAQLPASTSSLATPPRGGTAALVGGHASAPAGQGGALVRPPASASPHAHLPVHPPDVTLEPASTPTSGTPATPRVARAPQPAAPRTIAVVAAPTSSNPPTGPSAPKPADDPRGREPVSQAVERLAAHTSISAKLREEIDLYGQQVLATGSYLQGPGPQHPFRLEFVAKSGDRQSVLEQVCDGRTLWIFRRAGGKQTLSKVDMPWVAAQLANDAAGAQATAQISVPHSGLAIGGLPKLLANLNATFNFGAPQAGTMRGVAVWTLVGVWRPAALALVVPDKKDDILQGKIPDFAKLPDQLPEQVVLTLAQATLFPHRIEYRRASERAGAMQPRRFGKSTANDTIAAIELFDVALDVTLDSRQFVWSAGNLEAIHGTGDYLAALRATRQVSP